jgi:hypothetical protein
VRLIARKQSRRRRLPGRSVVAAIAASLSLVAASVSASAINADAAGCGTTNLALNHPATASSLQSAAYPASNAVDGNLSTRWSSAFSDPQWLQVDLGSTQSICQVTLAWEAAYGKAFQIQRSDDDATWTSIFSTTASAGGTQTLSVTGSGRYIRMYGTVRGTGYGYSLFEFEVFGGSGGSGGGGSGTFPVTFQNNTGSTWSNSQIYVLVLGQAVPGQWSYLKPDGTLAHISHLDASAPGHLTKNGVNYPNMSFTLAQASTVRVPAELEGARMYISVGSPMYIAVSPDDQGWAGPDLNNPADPNIDVYFDWYEFTYQFGVIPFGGNTTQVDMFGFPMTARLQQSTIGYDQTVGITLTRAQVMSQYMAAVGTAFTSLAGTYRIVAPRSSPVFQPGGAQAGYLQSYIDQTWAYYTTHQFTLTRLNQTFTGRVSGTTLTFTLDGTGPFVLNKPTTADVMACSGALASAGMNTTELALGAEFCAAFNRGVALNTADWYNPAAYYAGAVKNDYAGFFHAISLNHLAYGFAYDDINDQSSVEILPNANPPSRLTIGVGW